MSLDLEAGLDWRAKVELFEQIRREYEFGVGTIQGVSRKLARFIHDCEDTKSLFCYKHVMETVFARAREAFACLTIAQHSVCCSPVFFPSLPCCSSISGRAVPMAEPCC